MSKFNDVTQLERQFAQDKLVDTASTVTPTTIPKEFLDLPLPVAQAGTASSAPRRKKKMVRIDCLREHWAILLKRMGTESPSSTIADSSLDSSQIRPRTDEDPDADEVDEIVVDRDWAEDMKNSVNHSERAQENSGDGHITHIAAGTSTSLGHEIFHIPDDAGFFRQIRVFLRREVWPAVHNFFYVQFYDEKTERQYRKERWFYRKVFYLY